MSACSIMLPYSKQTWKRWPTLDEFLIFEPLHWRRGADKQKRSMSARIHGSLLGNRRGKWTRETVDVSKEPGQTVRWVADTSLYDIMIHLPCCEPFMPPSL